MKIKTLLAICVMALALSSCKKEPIKGDKGEKGDKGDTGATGQTGATGANGTNGVDAKTFNFTLTFNAGDTYQAYSGITGYNADDVIITYIKWETLGGTNYWTQLPVVVSNFVNIIPEFSETTGNMFINTEKADGTAGSPWTTSNTFAFKAVLISSAQRQAHPNLNWANYTEVKQALHLQD